MLEFLPLIFKNSKEIRKMIEILEKSPKLITAILLGVAMCSDNFGLIIQYALK